MPDTRERRTIHHLVEAIETAGLESKDGGAGRQRGSVKAGGGLDDAIGRALQSDGSDKAVRDRAIGQ